MGCEARMSPSLKGSTFLFLKKGGGGGGGGGGGSRSVVILS